ncbi:hypothetical protein PtB15_14B239 [Puccinia triticina]|nr:hypothetical protein PtB15_14B239 [Puccinia triticina]
MNHYLCSGRRPTAPCTAFSIQLVQYHHLLWQATAVSVSGFIESLSSFLNTWAATPLLNRGSSQKRCQLCVSFSHCCDLYSRILTSKKKLFEDGLQLTPLDKWANKCPRCFGPQHNEIKTNPDESDFMIALDGNFQQRHYADASKDDPREDQYPESFILPSKITNNAEAPPCSDQHKAADNLWNGSTWEKCDNNRLFANSKVGVLYDIGCHLEAHIIKRGLLSDRISDLANAEETSQLASDALQILYSTLNPATPGVAYTNTFLKQQWELEKSFHENFNQTREDQRKNLGELLCLQDDLDAAWQRATHTVAQAIVRANTCSDIAKQIVTQQIAIGANQLIDDLTS